MFQEAAKVLCAQGFHKGLDVPVPQQVNPYRMDQVAALGSLIIGGVPVSSFSS
jgi:hypothetical protein